MANGTIEPRLRDVESFSILSADTLQLLSERARSVSLEAGVPFVAEKAKYPGLIVIVTGQLKASRTNGNEKEQVFLFVEDGGAIGFAGALGRPVSPWDIVARRSTDAVVIPFDAVQKAIKQDGQFALLFADLAERQGDALRQLADDISLLDATSRLAKWLWAYLEKSYPGQGSNFVAVLPFTQSEIASQIGTVREVISRGLGILQKQGIISVSGKRLHVNDRKRLAQFFADA